MDRGICRLLRRVGHRFLLVAEAAAQLACFPVHLGYFILAAGAVGGSRDRSNTGFHFDNRRWAGHFVARAQPPAASHRGMAMGCDHPGWCNCGCGVYVGLSKYGDRQEPESFQLVGFLSGRSDGPFGIRWRATEPMMPRLNSRWMAWWYSAIALGFVLLAINRAIIGEKLWLIGVRVVIAL